MAKIVVTQDGFKFDDGIEVTSDNFKRQNVTGEQIYSSAADGNQTHYFSFPEDYFYQINLYGLILLILQLQIQLQLIL